MDRAALPSRLLNPDEQLWHVWHAQPNLPDSEHECSYIILFRGSDREDKSYAESRVARPFEQY